MFTFSYLLKGEIMAYW